MENNELYIERYNNKDYFGHLLAMVYGIISLLIIYNFSLFILDPNILKLHNIYIYKK